MFWEIGPRSGKKKSHTSLLNRSAVATLHLWHIEFQVLGSYLKSPKMSNIIMNFLYCNGVTPKYEYAQLSILLHLWVSKNQCISECCLCVTWPHIPPWTLHASSHRSSSSSSSSQWWELRGSPSQPLPSLHGSEHESHAFWDSEWF